MADYEKALSLIGGGSGAVIASMIDATTGEIDKSYADLMAAWTAKKQVLLFRQITTPTGAVLHESLVLCNLYIQDSTYNAVFGSVNYMNGSFVGVFFIAPTESAHLAYESD